MDGLSQRNYKTNIKNRDRAIMAVFGTYLAGRGSVNTLTGTLCNIVQPQDENDNDSKKNHENDNEDKSTSPDLATTRSLLPVVVVWPGLAVSSVILSLSSTFSIAFSSI